MFSTASKWKPINIQYTIPARKEYKTESNFFTDLFCLINFRQTEKNVEKCSVCKVGINLLSNSQKK